MLFLRALLTLAAVTFIVAQDLTYDSAAFNSSTGTTIVWSTPTNVDVGAIARGPPTLIINTGNVTSTFLAVMAYNYTATTSITASGIDSRQNETLTRWLWLQPSMTVAWASQYPIDKEATGATLTSGETGPIIHYTSPHIPSSTTPQNITIQIFRQTAALKSYLGLSHLNADNPQSLQTCLEKLSRFMNYDPSITGNADLMNTPRAVMYFSTTNSTDVADRVEDSNQGNDRDRDRDQEGSGGVPAEFSLDEPVTAVNAPVAMSSDVSFSGLGSVSLSMVGGFAGSAVVLSTVLLGGTW